MRMPLVIASNMPTTLRLEGKLIVDVALVDDGELEDWVLCVVEENEVDEVDEDIEGL
jgi:hypothetical protein